MVEDNERKHGGKNSIPTDHNEESASKDLEGGAQEDSAVGEGGDNCYKKSGVKRRVKVRRRYTTRVAFFHSFRFWTKMTVLRVYPKSRRWKMMRPKDPVYDDSEDVYGDLEVTESTRHRFRRTLLSLIPGGKKAPASVSGKKKDEEEDEDLRELGIKESLRFRVKRKLKKLAIWAAVGVVLVVAFSIFKQDVINLLRKNTVTWAVYTHIAGQLEKDTLLGLAYAGFFGALFFIMIPLEAVFFYYIALDYNPWVVLAIMQISSVAGLTADYLMGSMVGERMLLRYAAQTFKKTESAMENWGGAIVMVCNVIPFLPIQVISLGIGSTRFGLLKFLVLTFIGRLAYLIGLLYFADFFKALFA